MDFLFGFNWRIDIDCLGVLVESWVNDVDELGCISFVLDQGDRDRAVFEVECETEGSVAILIFDVHGGAFVHHVDERDGGVLLGSIVKWCLALIISCVDFNTILVTQTADRLKRVVFLSREARVLKSHEGVMKRDSSEIVSDVHICFIC